MTVVSVTGHSSCAHLYHGIHHRPFTASFTCLNETVRLLKADSKIFIVVNVL